MPACLGRLYQSHSRSVYQYLRGMVGHDEAEDLTQQVFLKLITRIDRYEPREDVPFSAWLRRVAHNLAVDYLRSSRPAPSDSLTAIPRLAEDTGLDRLRSLREALAKLPAAQRNVLVLRYVSGLSPTEIASLLGKSEAAIHGLHHRGRGELKRELIRRRAAPSTLARAA